MKGPYIMNTGKTKASENTLPTFIPRATAFLPVNYHHTKATGRSVRDRGREMVGWGCCKELREDAGS